MSNIIDQANEKMAAYNTDAEARIRRAAEQIQPGQPGECEICGEWSGRLVNGHCAPCRDKYKLS